jgi:hypothetical protein
MRLFSVVKHIQDKYEVLVGWGGLSLPPQGRPAFAEALRAGRLKSPLP